jgi:hypothetical protein
LFLAPREERLPLDTFGSAGSPQAGKRLTRGVVREHDQVGVISVTETFVSRPVVVVFRSGNRYEFATNGATFVEESRLLGIVTVEPIFVGRRQRRMRDVDDRVQPEIFASGAERLRPCFRTGTENYCDRDLFKSGFRRVAELESAILPQIVREWFTKPALEYRDGLRATPDEVVDEDDWFAFMQSGSNFNWP